MEKRYNHVKRNQSRFSFNEFCKMVWQMSNKDDWHYIDFKNNFHLELQALYFKTQLPILNNPDILNDRLTEAKQRFILFLKAHANTEPNADDSTFFPIGVLIDHQDIKPTNSQVRQAITELGYEFTYHRPPYERNALLGVWLKPLENELPF